MADPVSIMSIGSMGISAAGGILGAFGASQKDDATAAMYQYKAAVAQANEKIAQQNAVYETQRGGVIAQRAGLEGAQKMGLITASQAASGIDLNTGTARDVRTSQAEGIQTEEATIRNDAARRAYGEEVQGFNFAAEGQLDTKSAQFTEEQKGFDVASSVLGGAGSVADKWMKFNQAGVNTTGSLGFNMFG